MSKEIKTQVVVLGAGPAGYSAAFRCADLGLETVLVISIILLNFYFLFNNPTLNNGENLWKL